MVKTLLMPKATAVWLIDNTSLSFNQIAAFCSLHPLEVQAIADGDAAQGIKGLNPIISGQLTREEIEKAEADKNYELKIARPDIHIPQVKRGARYTPLSKRHDRPNAILWLVRNHPELKDAAISRLVGTTKLTIEQIRERKHWNIANLTPVDPVILGLCSQMDLDTEVKKAASRRPVEEVEEPSIPSPEDKLLPASFTEKLSMQDHGFIFKSEKSQSNEDNSA